MCQQAVALWKSQIPSYERIISRCCHRVLTPMTEFLPPDFEDKIQQFRQALLAREPESYEPYLDIIVHLIEGRKNTSNIQLADFLVREMGGTLKYWQNVILDVAEQTVYTPQLTVWHLKKLFDNKLYIDAEVLSDHRRLCRLTKTYLNSLNSLIKYITKFDHKKDSLAKIDQLFKKVKSAQEKYVGFSQHLNTVLQSGTMDQLSNNISLKSKQNALKTLYHFQGPSKQDKSHKNRNTLFNYKFQLKNKQVNEIANGPTKNMMETSRYLPSEKLKQFQMVIKNAKSPSKDIKQLRSIFKGTRTTNNFGQKKQNPINLTTIWDKDYFFCYSAHPIEIKSFQAYTEPFQRHDWVNYSINSDDEYQDLLGEDVQNNTEISSVSEDSRTSFVVSDGHLSDDEDAEKMHKELKPKTKNTFGDRWCFDPRVSSFNTKRGTYCMVIIDTNLKLPLPLIQKNELEQTLQRIVDGKDKNSIMEAISKQKIKISKAKLKQFMDRKCRPVIIQTNPTRTIYKIIDNQEQNIVENEKQNNSVDYIPETDEKQREEDDDTGMYDPQYFSVPPSRPGMATRRSKKQSSQKLVNSQAVQQRKKSLRSGKSDGSRNMQIKNSL